MMLRKSKKYEFKRTFNGNDTSLPLNTRRYEITMYIVIMRILNLNEKITHGKSNLVHSLMVILFVTKANRACNN